MKVRALTVEPGKVGSAELDERVAPEPGPQDVVVGAHLVGVCGTDREILAGGYGRPPEGETRLVLGHEAVGHVISAPDRCDLSAGELVVPIVRRPDPVPCASCAAGEWDMCRNGRFTEHGINGADGFATDVFTVTVDHAVPVPRALGELAVLVEPASIVAKAWAQVDFIARRASWRPHVALVTGAGPIGLLSALFARQRGLDTYVLDRATAGPKPQLVADIGAVYRTGAVADACPTPDVVMECTGVGVLVLDAIEHGSPNSIVCLAGLSSGSRAVELDATALNRRLVLENTVVLGSVNANRQHYALAVDALAAADPSWLGRLITRRVPLDDWSSALDRQKDDVKVVLEIATDRQSAG